MFHHHFRLYSQILFAIDAISLFPALGVAYAARYYLIRYSPTEFRQFFNPELLPFQEYSVYLLVFLPLWLFLLRATQRYSDIWNCSIRRQTARVANLVLAAGIVLGFIVFTLKLEVSRPVFFGVILLTAFQLLMNRVLFHWILCSRNLNEHNQIRILVVGTVEKAKEVGALLQRAEKWGYRVVGYITHNGTHKGSTHFPVLGSLSDLPDLLAENSIADEIIFTGMNRVPSEDFEAVIRLCEDLGIRTRVAADAFPSSISKKMTLEFLDDLPLITFSTAPDHNLGVIMKRVIDFTLAVFLLIVLLPLMVLVAVAIKLTSKGPVFYRQVRVGLHGRRFCLIKFRTMIDGAEDKLWEIRHLNEMDGPVFKMRNDPRVTPIGKFLRKSSIDELPQLWNVIKGEMSLVGPRAPLPEEVSHYHLKQRRRLSVKPGITCLWQISGRNEIDFERWMDLDLEYIDNWSLWLDLQIMLRTIPAVFTGRGAR
ncbi:MAG TPA: sugar transferase [Acidobacteriota bacterium]|nr:sugar transferase [Acidobacteriota bacterium]